MADEMELSDDRHEILVDEKGNFDFQKLKRTNHMSGYREGHSAGEESYLQQGFNCGFCQYALLSKHYGRLRGILSAVLSMKHLQRTTDEDFKNSTFLEVQNILQELAVQEQKETGDMNTHFQLSTISDSVHNQSRKPPPNHGTQDVDELNIIMGSVTVTNVKPHLATTEWSKNTCQGGMVVMETELTDCVTENLEDSEYVCPCKPQKETCVDTKICTDQLDKADSQTCFQPQQDKGIMKNGYCNCFKNVCLSKRDKITSCTSDRLLQITTRVEVFLIQNGFDEDFVKNLLNG